MRKNTFIRLWLARILIGSVLLVNLHCAIAFLLHPQDYMDGFGLSGVSGMGILRGLGLLFVMWNVPYAFALSHPVKHRTSLIEALIMQAVGLVGETIILLTGDFGNPVINATLQRFILFDGIGLLLLLLAFGISLSKSSQKAKKSN